MLSRACNYREDNYGYKFVVGPFYEFEEIEEKNIVVGEAREIVDQTLSAFVVDQDIDEINKLYFLDIASDDEQELKNILEKLSKLGWCTGL